MTAPAARLALAKPDSEPKQSACPTGFRLRWHMRVLVTGATGLIGGAVVGIILIFGPITGASLNPARAFGPELVQAIAGGTTFWTQYVPVYLVSGFVGAAGEHHNQHRQ